MPSHRAPPTRRTSRQASHPTATEHHPCRLRPKMAALDVAPPRQSRTTADAEISKQPRPTPLQHLWPRSHFPHPARPNHPSPGRRPDSHLTPQPPDLQPAVTPGPARAHQPESEFPRKVACQQLPAEKGLQPSGLHLLRRQTILMLGCSVHHQNCLPAASRCCQDSATMWETNWNSEKPTRSCSARAPIGQTRRECSTARSLPNSGCRR
mmetsp:Transcript_122013/g.390119  ORF Transcript_122013/g.390119 Transcript_122013/m.390119 type:complete len:209 (-) Transcript_122013:112-738(-)